ECYFYTLVNLMLGYYMLMCKGNYYSIKILDLFTFKFKKKGSMRYMPLIFTTYVSK
ncbi:uncharacterized protein BDR25DRAFT_240024, partial [Lindgomyces ingoldianus]